MNISRHDENSPTSPYYTGETNEKELEICVLCFEDEATTEIDGNKCCKHCKEEQINYNLNN